VGKEVFEVWHMRDERLRLIGQGDGIQFPSDYEVVAKVWAFEPEEAVRSTQTHGPHWSSNQNVSAVKEQLRDTAIYDIVKDARGNHYIVGGDNSLSRVYSPSRGVEPEWEV
jgi:hypothetical protein